MVLLRCLRRPRSLIYCSLSTSRTLHNNEASAKNVTKPFYITTPIFYPNASPHIGHLYSLVAADVFARFQRLKGRDTRFLAGTDEHGMKIQKAARAHFGGKARREEEFCNMLSERFRDLGRRASISNTCFMRTSSNEHHRAVEYVWRNLFSKGYIYKSQYEGWYSITDECFYTDSQVKHGLSLETGAAVEWTSEENYMFRLSAFREALLQHYLSHPRSVYPPQYHENVLGMLGGAPLHPPTLEVANDTEGETGAPAEKSAAIEDFILSDISISRPRSRLEWGIQVPDDPEQTVYVWFDALLIYLTGSGYPWTLSSFSNDQAQTSLSHNSMLSTASHVSAGLENGWPADIQVIGKDILRFHAIYFPAILLALSGGSYTPSSTSTTSSGPPSYTTTSGSDGIPVPLPATLLTHAHWTSSQKKMSKSLGNVVDPLEAMEKWSVDVVRFYLMRIGGRWRTDIDWSSQQLDKHYKEIQSQLGNYFLRISSPRIAERAHAAVGVLDVQSGFPLSIQRLFENSAPLEEPLADTSSVVDLNTELLRQVLLLPAKVEAHLDMLEAGNALTEVMAVLKLANKILTDIAPWASTTSPIVIHTTRLVALETLRTVGICLTPFMPTVSERLLEGLGQREEAYSTGFFVENRYGKAGMEALWTRWNGKEVKGVRLF